MLHPTLRSRKSGPSKIRSGIRIILVKQRALWMFTSLAVGTVRLLLIENVIYKTSLEKLTKQMPCLLLR